jgi:transcriptional regulator GlxA family with amidase domain
MATSPRTRRIVLLGYTGLTALDLSGPAEVFATASAWLDARRRARAAPAYALVVASLDRRRFVAENGLNFLADSDLAAAGSGDTLIVPGGKGLREPRRLARAAAWLRERHPAFRRVAAICTGAYALAEARLLDGAQATTHWRHAEAFAERYPAISLVVDALYLRHGRFYTSAGVTAGIDLCLSLVEQDHGPQCALAVARELVVHLKRAGGQRQYTERLASRGTEDARIAALSAWMLDHLDADLGVAQLAARCHCSERQLGRRFLGAFGLTPAAYVERLRVEEAGQHLVAGESHIDRIARSVGFRSTDVFRRAFERHYGIAPREYRERFRIRTPEESAT